MPAAASYVVAGYGDGQAGAGGGPLFELAVTQASAALAGVWAEVPPGRVRLAILALDAGGRVIGASKVIAFHKALGWGGAGAHGEAARTPRASWAETASQIMRWLARDVGKRRYDPDAPPYFWHSAVNRMDDEVLQRGAWPSRHNPLVVEGFLAYHAHGPDAALRAEALRRARGRGRLHHHVVHSRRLPLRAPALPRDLARHRGHARRRPDRWGAGRTSGCGEDV